MITEFEKKQAEKEKQRAKETLREMVDLKDAFRTTFTQNGIKTFLVIFERHGTIHGINCLPKHQPEGSYFRTKADGMSKTILGKMLVQELKDCFGQQKEGENKWKR